MRRFVVVGTGRSGTGYMSNLLTACGIPCGHEQVFGPAQATRAEPVVWGKWEADASWLAVPRLPMLGVPVVLVTRHPLPTVRSMVRIGQFTDDGADGLYGSVIRAFRPEVYAERTEPDRALAMWLHWTVAAAAHADHVLALEHLTTERLTGVLHALGADVAPDVVRRALRSTPRSNQRRDRKRVQHRAVWRHHRRGLADIAKRVAAGLGYDPEQPPPRPEGGSP